MASGFSLSEMGTEGGCCLKVVGAGARAGAGGGGGRVRGGESERSMGASWATVAVGVMGDTGGRSEVGDSERFSEAPEVDEAPLEEAGRRSVLTSSAGMAAEGEDVSRRGARECSAARSDRPRPRGWRGDEGGARRGLWAPQCSSAGRAHSQAALVAAMRHCSSVHLASVCHVRARVRG